ncbi:conserved unknown protein [Ectocarpus siliculosus]|uniref:Transmembrane protein n=1 Tax=Ectocarpus siliculosus TaxID=2880 RepID=D8LF13_ECTSI|nr:conserved unknown protein [Ectocarpus siliculosus]|eukprot:CBN79833.1 conserved unknown protein [Ectocarpus siliculosus]
MVDEGGADVCEKIEGSEVLLALRTLVKELLSIEVPSLKEFVLAFQAAFETSWHSLSAWFSVLTLFLSPVLQFLAVLARAVWPHAQTAAITVCKYQASLPASTLCAEAAAVVLFIALVLLRRFIVRQRYIPRARRRVRNFRARINTAYMSFTASVERNLRLSARAFPHVVYWTAAASFAWLAPDLTGSLRDKFWVFATATWPTLYAVYLVLLVRSQNAVNDEDSAGGSSVNGTPAGAGTRGTAAKAPVLYAPGARTPREGKPRAGTPGAGTPARSGLARGAGVMPQDVDRVLMYWVVFTVARCWGLLAAYVPETFFTPYVRTVAFFLALWMHLPGPGSGLQVVYAWLEPLVHTYVKDLRMPQNGYTGTLKRVQDLLVLVRLLTEEKAELLVDNITDSWMLVPALAFFLTPSFMTELACLYAGLVIPSFNSIKTLGRRSNTSAVSTAWAALATSADSARVRWLTYWVAYGSWWHLSLCLGGILRVLPLAAHAELALLLWLQVPLFRGGGRILDFGERCMDRWTFGSDVASTPVRPLTPPQQQEVNR